MISPHSDAEAVSDERLAEMLAGLEGVTQGDWRPWMAPSGQQFVRAVYTDSEGRRCTAWPAECSAGGQDNQANAAHIARCDPDTIRAIITELLSRRAANTTGGVQCCACGKTGLSTVEGDGGTECELSDGRWACSQDCYYTAVDWYSRSLVSPAVAEPVAWAMGEALNLAEAYIQEYEFDDGEAFHAPSEVERLLMVDMVNGLFSENGFIQSLRTALSHPSPAVSAEVTEAVRDVLAERRRQVEVEGWTPEHDDTHRDGELAAAAGVYALAAASHDYRWILRGSPVNDSLSAVLKLWPWDWSWFKPKDKRQDKVKAAALLLADIEREDRTALSSVHGGGE